ncbi:GHMP kinase [Pseudodesulfovibrio sp. zrk46]|uniref:GHMP family kinase ATP-binding protein n=1 Tax=Pseudodesulfovibrio sp. zrk46 TaxID=2725288 RepID=UPI001448BFE1|nr:GHMP kinase [Pseudodesulfovibrio sp. zrk46]QJB55746.1 GHMP kinase [Pseudodesulfovibrio sp. zrk46]
MSLIDNCESNLFISKTPLRISFFGGGSDIDTYYKNSDFGFTLSAAIDSYIYVTIKRHSEMFEENIRLNYSKSEIISDVKDIENDIIRESLIHLDIGGPLYISTVADSVAGTGLGTSSSFAVGLLNALHAFQGRKKSAGQLAEEACYIEIDRIDKPIGKQDQYAAAFGGMNTFKFLPDDSVRVEPLILDSGLQQDIFDHLVVFWTGIRRSADDILSEQREKTGDRITHMHNIRNIAINMRDEFVNGTVTPKRFGDALAESWESKKRMASGISSGFIDECFDKGIKAGAWGGKVAGAGGGGFLLFACPKDKQDDLRNAMKGMAEVKFACDPHGSRMIVGGM